MLHPHKAFSLLHWTQGCLTPASTQGVMTIASTQGVLMVASTPGLFMLASTQGLLTIAPADGTCALLHRQTDIFTVVSTHRSMYCCIDTRSQHFCNHTMNPCISSTPGVLIIAPIEILTRASTPGFLTIVSSHDCFIIEFAHGATVPGGHV